MEIIAKIYKDEDKIVLNASSNDRFVVRGAKMYIGSFEDLIDQFSKREIKMIMQLLKDTKKYDRFNVLTVSFRDLFDGMDRTNKSKFKRKLLEHKVIAEYNGKYMINPYILLPKGTKDIRNSQYWIQRVWMYLFVDKDKWLDGIDDMVEVVFGRLD
jgi:hypothetical protein